MIAKLPPMGWNSWNTFGGNISEKLIYEVIDVMASQPIRNAGYQYVNIDDHWSEHFRDEDGKLVPDHVKFPHGIKCLADYAHSKGLKFGIYSDAGVRTCGGFPGSYDHEYVDALTFAEWGIDYLKYDFCNFPTDANNKNRYLTMSMALRASGRDILFSACNWGRQEPSKWMRSIGAHMYRSDTDIRDNYVSTANIIRNQITQLNGNAPGCFNDLDMLTVGMNGCGLVAKEGANTFAEYQMQFAFWCMTASPLIMGCDVRHLTPECLALLTNKDLIAINQDRLCLPPYLVQGDFFDEECKKDTYILMKLLENGDFALGFFNLRDNDAVLDCIFYDCGIPYIKGIYTELYDVINSKPLGNFQDDIRVVVKSHECRVMRGRVVRT